MGQILTNFKVDTKMVLTDEESKVVAIINIPKGENVDISSKVFQAIKDDLTQECAEEVETYENLVGNEFTYEFNFDAVCIPEDAEEDELELRTFRLEKVAEY